MIFYISGRTEPAESPKISAGCHFYERYPEKMFVFFFVHP
jgi:hypothetical protein